MSLSSGDVIEARWTDRSSVTWSSTFTVAGTASTPATGQPSQSGGVIGPSARRCFAVAGSPGDAAVVNLTPVGATGYGYGVLVSSDVTNAPTASNVNYALGSTDPNVAMVPIGADGRVCFENAPFAAVDLVADQLGTVAADSYRPATTSGAPRRVIDTRQNGGVIGPSARRCFAVAGSPGDAAVVNLTPVGATGYGYGVLVSSDVTNAPTVSNVNYALGSTDPNVAMVPIGADGRVCFENAPFAAVDLVADQLGTVAADSYRPATTSGAPRRVIDTRSALSSSTRSVGDAVPTPPATPAPAPSSGSSSGSGPVADGVNPPYNGSEGIWPTSPHLIPSGFPTPATTGVPAGVRLTSSGSLEITKAGTVIDGLDINGNVEIRADNVTIRNSRITSNAEIPVRVYKDGNERTYSGFVIEDSRIRGVGRCSAAIGLSNYTARRVHISGCSDGAKAFSNTTIEDSYLAGFYRVDGETHNDAIQSSGGSNIVIRRNTVLGPYQMSTSAIILQANQSALSNVLVEGNYLSGGSYTIYTSDKGAGASNIRVINNVFERDGWLYGWKSTNTSAAVYSGNTIRPPS